MQWVGTRPVSCTPEMQSLWNSTEGIIKRGTNSSSLIKALILQDSIQVAGNSISISRNTDWQFWYLGWLDGVAGPPTQTWRCWRHGQQCYWQWAGSPIAKLHWTVRVTLLMPPKILCIKTSCPMTSELHLGQEAPYNLCPIPGKR